MSTPRSRTRLRSALALIALSSVALIAPTVSLADQHGGGGGGGGHSFSGGGHGGAPHFAGGGGHAPGAQHGVGAAHYAAPNFAAHPGYGGYTGNRAANYGARPVYTGGGNAVNHYVAPYGHGTPGGYYNRGGNYNRGGYYAHGAPGRYIPGRAFNYHYWHGGYWRGGFWPGVYWGSNFAWFLPAIPAFAAAYWWDSVPYYYYNNVYYTYDQAQNGYVVTTPPPADDSSTAAPPASAPDTSYADAPSQDPAPAADSSSNAGSAGMGNLYAYPKDGQSEEQQSSDRQECAQWASGQTNPDGTGTSMDYQRALSACLQGRGYSVD